MITTTPMMRIAAAVSHKARLSARLTAGGGSSRLIRSFERSAAGGALTPRRAQAADCANAATGARLGLLLVRGFTALGALARSRRHVRREWPAGDHHLDLFAL